MNESRFSSAHVDPKIKHKPLRLYYCQKYLVWRQCRYDCLQYNPSSYWGVFLSHTSFMHMHVPWGKVILSVGKLIHKTYLLNPVLMVQFQHFQSSYPGWYVSVKHYEDGSPISSGDDFTEELTLNAHIFISKAVHITKWQTHWVSRWWGHSTQLKSCSINGLKLYTNGSSHRIYVWFTDWFSFVVNTRPWLCYC